MRVLLPAVASLLALAALAGWAEGAASTPASAPSGAAAPATPGGTNSGSSADNEAAAKHAKRTACINQARAKKLVGTQKSAFIRSCIAAP